MGHNQQSMSVQVTQAARRDRPEVGVAVREALLVLLGTVFLALTAQIKVDLPFTPVPITGQTLGVLLVGSLYGPRRGALTVLAYLAEGLAGMPVFAGGRAGVAVLLGPTGGYLVGFVLAALVAGLLGASDRPLWLRLTGAALASVAVYLIGAPWLAVVGALPLSVALVKGVLPFLIGDAIKAALATVVTPAGAALLARSGMRPF
jgi:biotin transport system substrate-specific component